MLGSSGIIPRILTIIPVSTYIYISIYNAYNLGLFNMGYSQYALPLQCTIFYLYYFSHFNNFIELLDNIPTLLGIKWSLTTQILDIHHIKYTIRIHQEKLRKRYWMNPAPLLVI